MWRGLSTIKPSIFTKKGDLVPRPIAFICSQMEQNQASQPPSLSLSLSLCPSVSFSQSIMRMRNICGHCQLDNQGMFMISEGGRDEETAIYQPDLSLCKPTHTDSLHTLTPRKGRSWPFFLISHLYRKNPETFASDVPSVQWKLIRLHTSESSRAGKWGSQNYKKLTKFTAKLQGIKLFTCDWLGNVLIAHVLPHAWAPWSHQIQSHAATRMWNVKNLVAAPS